MECNRSQMDQTTLSLGYSDYQRFSQLVQDRFGLAFPENRRIELEIGVRRAFAASTCRDLASYYQTLLDPVHGELEIERLVNALTVGETHFFRDAGQFDALFNNVLPELISRNKLSHTLRIWSAGCASGEEPYSVAILLCLLLPDIEHWNITILGTDVNTLHLERARRAIYSEWAFRETRAKALRPQFFIQRGNQYELSPKIRRMVQFRPLNLSENCYPSYETNTMYMDLILCRNVTIYFPDDVTRQLVNRFYNALTDNGWLVIGHSEHSLETYKRFHACNFHDTILYHRIASSPSMPDVANGFTPLPYVNLAPHVMSIYPAVTSPGQQNARKPASDIVVAAVMKVSTEGSESCTAATSQPDIEEASIEQAQTLISFGHVDEARELLLRWLADHPGHAAGCALLGTAYANMGDMTEAERWCKLAISHDRLCLEAYYSLALVFQHQDQREQAIEMMKKVIYINRNDILGHFSLANLYHNAGQYGLALKFLGNARRMLEGRPIAEIVPRSGAITVGRLVQTVIELHQIWANKASS